MLVAGGSTDVTTYFALRLAADGTAATALTITNFDLQYVRSGASPAAKVDATALAAIDSAHGDNKAFEVDATDQPGLYRVDWPDAAFAAGVREVILTVKCATCFTEHLRVEIDGEVNVVEWAGTDVVAGAIPAAAADAAGGLIISDAGGKDFDAMHSAIGTDGTNLTEAGGTGDHLTAINLPNQTMDIVGSITGNLSGSVGSVTGAVGSVTGAVGSVTGSVGSVVGHTPQTADHTAGIADIPTVSEFNARTLPTASYFDPAADTVANVTTVATLTGHTPQTVDHAANIAAILTDTGTTLQAELDAIQAAVITNAAGADIAADIIAVKAETASILTDTGTTLPATLASILADTGTTLQAELDAIQAAVITNAAGADIAADIIAVKAETAAILTDTGTTLQAELDAIQAATITNAAGADIAADIIAVKAETAAIVADTNELQADNVPGLIAGLNDPTAAVVADAVWDEAKAGHVGVGSFGEEVQAHALTSEITALNDLSAAEVNAECDQAITDAALATAAVCTEARLAELDAANLPADVDSVLADTNELQADWTNGGRLDLIVDAILADTGTDGVVISSATANAIADALLDRADGVEPGSAGTERTVRESLRIILSACGGKASGLDTATAVYRDTNDTKDRITATVDADGNRTAVTLVDT